MSTGKVSWLITDNNITVNYDGQTHIVSRDEKLADQLIKAVKEQKLTDIPSLVSAAKRVEKFSHGNFVVRDGEIFVDDQLVPNALGKKILQFDEMGLPYQPLVKFARNLQQNPSYRAVNELFQFLEKNDHPITEDGLFIAYKKVRDDFKDVHSATFDNSPGKTVEVPRNQVDEDSSRTCSNGLHAANYNYASQFYSGGKMLEVEVNPADVVSIPTDYDQAKMRVCKYKVLGVVDKAHDENEKLRVSDSNSDLDEDDAFCEVCGDYVDMVGDFCFDCQEEEEYPFDNEL